MKTDFQYTAQQLSLILAAAVCEQFGQAKIVKAWDDQDFFFVDVALGSEWEENYLPLVEEQMKKLLQQKKSFEELEMSVAGAAAFFASQSQELLSLQLPNQKNVLTQVLRYGDWAIPFNTSTTSATEGMFFSLLATIEVGRWEDETIYRIKGVVSTQALKKKELDAHAMQDLNQLIEQLELLKETEAGWSYLPKGETARQLLLESWKKLWSKENFRMVSIPHGLSKTESYKQLIALIADLKSQGGSGKLAQLGYLEHEPPLFDYGVLTPQRGFQDLFCLAVPEAKLFESIISSLQLMRQIPRIFSFKMQAILCASQSSFESSLLQKALAGEQYAVEPSASTQTSIELRLIDEDGCSWSGPTLGIMKAKLLPGSWIVVGSLLGSWERFLALAVQKKKRLPFALVEEQVRIFLLHPDFRAYADAVSEKLRKGSLRVSIDEQAASLKERVHDAIKEGIPYLIVVGSKEQELKKISWRTCDSETETTMTVEEFVNMVKH